MVSSSLVHRSILSSPFLLERPQFDSPYNGLLSFYLLRPGPASPHQNGNGDTDPDKEHLKGIAENSINNPLCALPASIATSRPGLISLP
jgi:hypothetical protein